MKAINNELLTTAIFEGAKMMNWDIYYLSESEKLSVACYWFDQCAYDAGYHTRTGKMWARLSDKADLLAKQASPYSF